MNKNPEVSIILPCLNEEDSLGICLRKIKEVFAQEGILGEIIVVDNGSVDRSAEIARREGVKIIFEPIRGYGSAYLRGLKEVCGEYIVIADSDNTYDFYEIPIFLKALKENHDLVVGSRFKGKINKGAMPFSHRYIGNPILSGMCRLFFHTRLSDINCGMRAFTCKAYKKMQLKSRGMELATEMVVSSLEKGLKICEVAINYYPRKGKSKLRPFYDAWRQIRFMLLYCPFWLYFIPGIAGLIFGIFILLLLVKGPFLFLGHPWDIHFMAFASLISILSYQVLNLGIYAHTFAVKEELLRPNRLFLFFQRFFNMEKGIILGIFLFLTGFIINLFILIEWISRHLGTLDRIRESILAMTLIIIGLQTIFSSFFISLLFLKREDRS